MPGAAAGTDYSFRLDGGEPLADPRSPWQPHGVRGPSRAYDHGRSPGPTRGGGASRCPAAVIYELHVGTFTPEGTFDAAIGRLDHLVDLGVDAVELMPVAAFPGTRGWGYDGVGLWAVHEPYGGPDGLKRLRRRLPRPRPGRPAGRRLQPRRASATSSADFGPYFTEAAQHAVGAGGQPGRARIGRGPRLHHRQRADVAARLPHRRAAAGRRARASPTTARCTLLEELAAATDALAAQLGRPLVLIAESDLNDPRLVTAREAGGTGLTAQWSDDFHHALHAALTGEQQGYYADFGSLAALAQTLTRVFLHDGTWSSFRGRSHGRPVDRAATPAHRFLGYLQDHDQIGNRATGDRIADLVPDGLLQVGAGLVLTAPFTPMLFMGEEWGADTPWQYFTDHEEGWLADAVREGRRNEFAAHGWAAADVPDPQDPQTFARSRLDWSQPAGEPHAGLLAWYRELIALRRARPELTDPRLDRVAVRYDEDARWLVITRGRLLVVASLGAAPLLVPLPEPPTAVLAASRPGVRPGDAGVTMPGTSLAVLES